MNSSYFMNYMDFLEVSFSGVPEGFHEILIAELAEAGFDGFTEDENQLLAYIRRGDLDEPAIHRILQKYPELNDTCWSVVSMPEKNWNEVWESNYEPVLIADRCYIRAPFHPSLLPAPGSRIPDSTIDMTETASGIRYPASDILEIIIEPKMSFGTAHHETTALMIEWLLEEPVTGEKVLDMGCGTGVLAILAAKLGAARIVAIDNNPWAVENTRENTERNNCSGIDVILGEAADIPEKAFDLILANINRNVLLEQIPVYGKRTGPEGRLLLSGFFAEDLPKIEACAAESGLRLTGTRMKNKWVAAKFYR